MDVRAPAANHSKMKRSEDRGFWLETLQADPQIFHRLMADLWKAVQVSDGRPTTPPTSADSVLGVLIPEYSTAPFHVALRAKMGERSIQWLADQIGVPKATAGRWLTGRTTVVKIHEPGATLHLIEAIAAAVRVHPSYFAEWRRIWVLMLLDDAFTQHPNLSIGVWKKFAGASMAPMNGR